MPSFNEEGLVHRLQLPNHSQVTGFCKSFSSICIWVFCIVLTPRVSLGSFVLCTLAKTSKLGYLSFSFLPRSLQMCVCCVLYILGGITTTALPFYFSLQEKKTTKSVLAPQTQVSLVEYYTREMAFHWGWGKMLFTRR